MVSGVRLLIAAALYSLLTMPRGSMGGESR